ncbi:hypothetical protein [Maribacter litoralis]|uniref:hypothetical protein n=1 Tax=Maribacter litoralis TaxID=2059726 RepID=UPI003D284DB2
MKKLYFILIFLVVSQNFVFSQTEMEIDSLLQKIAETENSRGILKTVQAEKIISYGESSLPILSDFFTDSTETKVFSECQARNLSKGELAIIMADGIDRMPYMRITGIQNCLLTYCENNPNWIEYYLFAINRDGLNNFQTKYKDWLAYLKLSDKKKRKVERKNSREFRTQQRNFRRMLKNNSR